MIAILLQNSYVFAHMEYNADRPPTCKYVLREELPVELIECGSNDVVYDETTDTFQVIVITPPVKTLDEYKQDKIDSLSAICQGEILSDFTSDALGTTHTYGFDEVDQKNLQGIGLNLALDTTLTDVMWKTRESVTFITHTRDQMIQVIKDAATHQKTIQYKYLNLKYEIQQAVDEAAVDAIVW